MINSSVNGSSPIAQPFGDSQASEPMVLEVSPPPSSYPTEHYYNIFFCLVLGLQHLPRSILIYQLLKGCDPTGLFKNTTEFKKTMCEIAAGILDLDFSFVRIFAARLNFHMRAQRARWHRWHCKSQEIDGSEDIYVRYKVQNVNILDEEKSRSERKYALYTFYPGCTSIVFFYHASMLESKSPHCCQ